MTLLNEQSDAFPYRDQSSLGSNSGDSSDAVEDVGNRLSSKCEEPNLYYDMTGEKILIIFNHYRYKKTRHFKFVPKKRSGTYQDVKKLEKTFRHLGFVVITHDDWKHKEIMKYLSDVCEKNHSDTSCITIAVMTHGKGSQLCAADRLYPVTDIFDLLRTAPALVGIPKLFFIQACRGGHTRPNVQSDQEITFPVDAECLTLYSTYEDYLSYRNQNGSWFMQALCDVVHAHHGSMDLMRMATLVNSRVAAKSSIWGKQMPVTKLNLTRLLML